MDIVHTLTLSRKHIHTFGKNKNSNFNTITILFAEPFTFLLASKILKLWIINHEKKTKIETLLFQVVSLIEDVISNDLFKELKDESFYRKYFSIDLLVESPILFQAFNRCINQLNFYSNVRVVVPSNKSRNISLVTSI
jgi:hypothetical protein